MKTKYKRKNIIIALISVCFVLSIMIAGIIIITKKSGEEKAPINENIQTDSSSPFAVVSYYKAELEDRYVAYQSTNSDLSIEDIVTYVNIGIDVPFFTNEVTTISNPDDITVLVNKMYKLPDGFVPTNLVETSGACTQGVQYSCFSGVQYVREEVNQQFINLTRAAASEVDVTITAIASYRDMDYQGMLYNSGVANNGQEYADKYYARAGQSEHQTGLAIDITMDDYSYELIENHPQYNWLLSSLADYGFILRYPEGKSHITGYDYESWHIRYVGVDLAKQITNSGLTYEEFIARGMM